jgi:hypothetical protein
MSDFTALKETVDRLGLIREQIASVAMGLPDVKREQWAYSNAESVDSLSADLDKAIDELDAVIVGAQEALR